MYIHTYEYSRRVMEPGALAAARLKLLSKAFRRVCKAFYALAAARLKLLSKAFSWATTLVYARP
jgi:hypothetical protein